MVHGIPDGGRGTDRCHLAQPFGAHPGENGVRFVNEFDLEVADVCVHRDLILGDIIIEKASVPWIDLTRLAERRPDPPGETAIDLAGGRTTAEHTAAIHYRNNPNDSGPEHARSNMYLNEMRDEREANVVRKLWAGESYFTQCGLPECVRLHAWCRTAPLALHVIQTVVAEDILYALAATIWTDQRTPIELQACSIGASELRALDLCRKYRQSVAQADRPITDGHRDGRGSARA